MKYIHDGTDFIIWLVTETYSHEEIAHMFGMKPIHAGFLSLRDKQVSAYGRSVSLDLVAKHFHLPDLAEIYASRDVNRFNNFVISSNREYLRALSLLPEQATWHKSAGGEYDGSVEYLDVPNPPKILRTQTILM